MIIGKYDGYYTAFVSSAGSCGKTRQGKHYWREGAYNSSPFNSCAEAQRDWDKKYGNLNIIKHPDSTAGGGGTSGRSVGTAQGTYQPKTVSTKGQWQIGGFAANSQQIAKSGGHPTAPLSSSGSSNTIKGGGGGASGKTGAGLGASGSAGVGISGGASIKASVSNLQAKADQVVSDILPDTIEEKLPENFPLWIIPAGLVGGLVLILLMRR